MFNLIYVHLLERNTHSADCTEDEVRGLVCAQDCDQARFLESLDAPLMSWEIAAEQRLQERRLALLRGDIPA